MLRSNKFIVRTQSGLTTWIDPGVNDQNFVDALGDVDMLIDSPSTQIVKDARKTKVARINVAIAGSDRVLYVKRYNAFSLRYRLLSPFVLSGAQRALEGALILQQAHIAAAKPVAAVERRRWSVLLNSFFISEEIAGGKTAMAYWNQVLKPRQGRDGFRRRRCFVERMAQLIRSVHAARIYHNDLKEANILAVGYDGDPDCALFLLDLEGVRQCKKLSARRRIKNLVQVYRTLGRYLSKPKQLFFLKSYLGNSSSSRLCIREWMGAVLRYARHVDRLKDRSSARAVSR